MKNRRPYAFTLIELLVVITIIAILAGIIVNTMGSSQRSAAKKRAQVEIEGLTTALERYKTEYGNYPKDTNGDPTKNTAPNSGNSFLVEALQPTASNYLNPRNIVFYEFPKSMTNENSNVVDPFGDQYGYQYPGSSNRSGTNFFELWSRVGTTNNKEWLKNW